MECKFCHNKLSSKSALNTHQKTARYCLKIQGKTDIKGSFICKVCDKNFLNNNRYKSHVKICKSNTKYIIENKKLKDELISVKKENEILRGELEKTQERYDKLSLTAVKRPVTSTKNIQINNYIQNMEPLRIEDITQSVPMLTLDHHVKGAEGYAEYALEFPFKNKIVCLDVNRNKIKYKNDDGDVIEDIGFQKMMTNLCKSLKDRSFNLCQEHYEKLSAEFTESEMEEYNCMETAMAITRYANGRENDFCNKVIKLISKGSKI
uniref:C2H2-type domain-containing protein n=1 Tax=viral metagenome TaxID=1070528 RepID=A0A6C0JMR7_9ZZZZ